MFFDVINSNAKHSHLDSSAFSVHTPRREDTSRPSSIRGRDMVDSTTDLAALADGRRSAGTTPRASFQAPDEDTTHHEKETHLTEKHHKKNHFQHLFTRTASNGALKDSHHGSHVSLLESLRKIQEPVGVFESERYMDVERSQSQYVYADPPCGSADTPQRHRVNPATARPPRRLLLTLGQSFQVSPVLHGIMDHAGQSR